MRFSAFLARLPNYNNRSIEQIYQCDIKGYDVDGINWRLGKGKIPINNKTRKQLLIEYVDLWKQYFNYNPELLIELKEIINNYNNNLNDRFAKTIVNQAYAISVVLNGKHFFEV